MQDIAGVLIGAAVLFACAMALYFVGYSHAYEHTRPSLITEKELQEVLIKCKDTITH